MELKYYMNYSNIKSIVADTCGNSTTRSLICHQTKENKKTKVGCSEYEGISTPSTSGPCNIRSVLNLMKQNALKENIKPKNHITVQEGDFMLAHAEIRQIFYLSVKNSGQHTGYKQTPRHT